MSSRADYGSTSTSSSEEEEAGAPAAPPTTTTHLSTYTAGEDAGRLANLAREFGLSNTRRPRDQVRTRVSDSLGELNLERLKLWAERIVSLDQTYLEMRYRSVYSPHGRGDSETSESDEEAGEEEAGPLLVGDLPTLADGDDDDEEEEDDERRHGGAEEKPSEDPHAAGLGGTLPSAALGIVKGMVGPAILYLPHGFAGAGYLVAVPVLALTTALFLWSSGCLLESWREESHRANNRRGGYGGSGGGRRAAGKRITLSYPGLAYRAFGAPGERLVQVGISLMQSGVCLTYLIFVPQNLRMSALLLMGWDVSTTKMLTLMVAAQIPLSWIRDIRRLTVTNLLANVLILYGLLTCLVFAMDDIGGAVGGDEPNGSESFFEEAFQRAQSLTAFNPSGWFLFLGTSVLLFEGSITLLVPLQEAVHSPADRRKFPTMYRKVILGIVSFYAFFGVACWMAFGDNVRTVMTTSLPPGKAATTVQLAYSLAVVFTFPLQNFPSLEIISAAFDKIISGHGNVGKGSGEGDNTVIFPRRNIVSTLLVVVLSVVAALTMDDLDKVVSLMGSLLGCPLAFVLPPMIQNQLDKGRLPEWKKRGNYLVAALGVGAMVVSSVCTILKWD